MRTEVRFLVAVALMMGVLVGTNLLFPPVVPEEPVRVEPAAGATAGPSGTPTEAEPPPLELPAADPLPSVGAVEPEVAPAEAGRADSAPRKSVVVESPLYRLSFSNYGGVAESVVLPSYRSFARPGAVDLVPEEGEGILGGVLVAGTDTVDLTRFPYEVSPAEGLILKEGDGPQTLTLRYDHPQGRFFSEIRYTFVPDSYMVLVEGRLPELDRAALYIDLGPGLSYNEVDQPGEARMMAFAGNHVQDGVVSRPLSRVDDSEQIEGPLFWAAVKSKFFVEAILAGDEMDSGASLAGIWADPLEAEDRARIRIGAPVESSGRYVYRAYMGPIERDRLAGFGDDLEEVNPYGWRFFRPIVRPFVGVVLWVLKFLHEQLLLGYGWVLIVFGVAMRLLLWPLNQKAMRAQIRNMAVQPLMQEIQKKYKDQPEQLQKEMLKLYKDHGFNPLGGCLPMLLPWPVLIALFFVFQNTIELRGVPFLWLPDLSAPDPLYLLPLLLGVSMFLLQFISMKSVDTVNPQMKMMMWIMPIMMVFIFFRFAAGLNLYYMTANIATLPQQILIARERKRARAAPPLKLP